VEMTDQRDEPRGNPSGKATGSARKNHGPNSNIPMPDPGLMSRSIVGNMTNVAYRPSAVVVTRLRDSCHVTP